MAIRFWEIYEETKERFCLKIIAGKAGMDTVIRWVHMLEDEIIVSRFHGEELAITTGMKAEQPNWLMNLVQKMADEECAGLIINTGMYLKEIPREVIAWCEEKKFPLLEMPWEISITGLIQDYCMRIIDQSQYEKKISNAFREIILGQKKGTDFQELLGDRYDINGTYQVFSIQVKKTIEEELIYTQAVLKLENLFGLFKGSNKINISYGLLRMNDSLALILNNRKDKHLLELPDLIKQSFAYFSKKHQFFFGFSSELTGIEQLPISYKRARTAMKMAIATNKELIKFEDMGFYQILFSVEDNEILKHFVDEILGPLIQYDKEHKTQYVDMLRSYIKNDRSLIRVAEDTFTHRNTVNYRIQNMKSILKCDLKNSKELFPYQVAFYIKDMQC